MSRSRLAKATRTSASFLVLCFGSMAMAQGPGPGPLHTPDPSLPPTSTSTSTTTPRPTRSSDDPTPIASNRSSLSGNTGSIVGPNLLRASARLEGTPSPGLRMKLDASASTGGRVWYRWLQTQGPKVVIEDASKVEAQFTVPTEATSLGFVLVIGNATGVDAVSLLVDVVDPEVEAESKTLKADAGDDQSAKVGRRVVLNGVRSEPRGKLRFRWIQVGGPKVSLRSMDGPTATFVPSSSGNYQFALVVASTDGSLSEASTVSVSVGGTVRASVDGPSLAIDELARISLNSIEGGTRYAEDLSKAFDGVADRIETFRNFSEAIAEMTRRLDAVVPRDKERRSVWVDQMFSPLMAKLVIGMKLDGLDLATTEAQTKPLTKMQRSHLAEQLRYTAAGLRSARTTR